MLAALRAEDRALDRSGESAGARDRTLKNGAITIAQRFEVMLEACLETGEHVVRPRAEPLAFDGARIRYMASVGISVREKKYDAHIANTTASASGTNR